MRRPKHSGFVVKASNRGNSAAEQSNPLQSVKIVAFALFFDAFDDAVGALRKSVGKVLGSSIVDSAWRIAAWAKRKAVISHGFLVLSFVFLQI